MNTVNMKANAREMRVQISVGNRTLGEFMRKVGEEHGVEFGQDAGEGDERVERVTKTDGLVETDERVRWAGGEEEGWWLGVEGKESVGEDRGDR